MRCDTTTVAEHTATVDDVRALASSLPRSYEVFVHGRVKFRVGRIVWLALSHDQTVMGFSFPREFREALVESAPEKFELPRQSDLRFNWVHVRLGALDPAEMRELIVDAWSTVVPKFVAASYGAANPDRGEPGGAPPEPALRPGPRVERRSSGSPRR